ncbi:adenylate cyclase [Tieghemiomyces parasiticus]|uniref:N-acyl-aliphatic-L-amino acid amidohydrolase n=1 Tax=Tieghemiomyces parasiticus TaxID=78921 RepID=A0A9W8A448_9FUNG|nr:adenylate cyclase [Tieghemiomyces parasiticus]
MTASLPEFPTSVKNFQRYLQIKTVQPTPDYATCAQFLRDMADELGLPHQVYEMAPGKPIVVMTWEGKDPTLPSIGLNSHTDVVPVYEEFWSEDPFAANIVQDDAGEHRIIARGTQDTKILGMCYLEAIRELRNRGVKQLLRTVHVIFVPDEEIGADHGMMAFVQHDAFKKLNLGLMLDEGAANPDNSYKVFYGEKAPWWARFTAEGNTGHGSKFIPNTAAPKLMKAVNALIAFHTQEEKRFLAGKDEATGKPIGYGDVTSANLTMLSGGKQQNVVPRSLEAYFDIRVSPFVDYKHFDAWLADLAHNSDVTLEYKQQYMEPNVTRLENNPWWTAMQRVGEALGTSYNTQICPGATDSRWVRPLGIPCLGVSPMRNLPLLAHDNNEYVTVNGYLEGIRYYEYLIEEVGNLLV